MEKVISFLFFQSDLSLDSVEYICQRYPQDYMRIASEMALRKREKENYEEEEDKIEVMIGILQDIGEESFLGDIWPEYEERYLNLTGKRDKVEEVWVTDENGITWTEKA